jgi:two-component sensor histidine kinase
MLLSTIGFGVLLWQARETSRREFAAQGRETAQVLSLAVDAELERARGVLSALSASDAMRNRDWSAVDRQARAAFTTKDAWIVVQSRDGRQWVNTRLARGAALPKAPPPQKMWQALDAGRQHVCDLSAGAIQARIVCVDVGDEFSRPPAYALSVVFRPEFFRAIVRRQNQEAGELASLVDRNGIVIWRNIRPDAFVGKATTSVLRERMQAADAASLESESLEGVRMLTAFQRSPRSGWSVIVGMPLKSADKGSLGALMHGSLFALILVLLGCALAAILGRRLTRGLEQLGQVLDPDADFRGGSTGFTEFDAAAAALRQASDARLRSERNQQMLIGELNHRVKNTLSVVQSLAHQTFREAADPRASIRAFELRLQALGQAHNLLTRERWRSASLDEIVQVALAPFCSDDRCSREGPDIHVPPQTAVTLALALHELATNAVKYGALSVREGHITVRWSGDARAFELLWAESGGPPATEPARRGFGTRLIERSLATELNGTATIDFLPEGLRCRVVGRLATPGQADVLDVLEA